MTSFFKLLPVLLVMGTGSVEAHSSRSEIDTSYISSYVRKLTGRVYMSQKYSRLRMNNSRMRLTYKPNTSLNLGVGATYESLTLNLAYGFDFLNPDHGQGKTKYLDLQSHLYSRHWVTDVYGQFYRGYYLKPQEIKSDSYYLRPDLKLRMVGASVYRLSNGERFSYRAAFVQNEWQKKSAGSWLYGAEIYYGVIKADSALKPSVLAPEYTIEKVRFYKLGPGGGYAYTWVLNRHFFATGSLTANLNLTMSHEYEDEQHETRLHVRPNVNYRAVLGYNSRLWNVNVSLVNSDVGLAGASRTEYLIRTGNYRLTVAKRFDPGKKLRKLAREKRRLLDSGNPIPNE